MKKLLITTLAAATFFTACKKDETTKPTTTVQTGTIRFLNNSSGGNRYEIFLDGGSLGLQAANTYYDKTEVPTGSHIVKAKQYEGFAISPTVREKTITVTQGATIQFSFPD